MAIILNKKFYFDIVLKIFDILANYKNQYSIWSILQLAKVGNRSKMNLKDTVYFICFLIAGFFCRYNPIYFKKKYPPASIKKIPGKAALFIPCKGVFPAFKKMFKTF